MLDCFLLLHNGSGGKWVPLFAMFLVIAGGTASVRLMLSGLKGMLAARHRPERRPRGHDRPQLIGL